MPSDLLIGGGLEGGSRVIDELRRRERRQWQEWRIDEELTRLETVFSEAFTDALRDAAEESDHREELRTIARRWENNPEGEDIVMAFDDVDLAVETEAATVSRILAVTQDRVEIGTESREDVREAIIVAYREGFSSFLEEINTKDPVSRGCSRRNSRWTSSAVSRRRSTAWTGSRPARRRGSTATTPR